MCFLGILLFVGVCFFFFFQAEDGIRDWSVTGIQTCALPIWPAKVAPSSRGRVGRGRHPPYRSLRIQLGMRVESEERRVGKECRSRGWREREKKKGRK